MAATKRGGKKKSAKKTASKKVKAARAAKPAKRGKAVAKPPKKKAAPKRAAPRAVAGTEVKQAASAPARIAVDKAYEALVSHLKGVAVLESVSRTIGWDQETMMPAKAANLRAEQMQLLAGMMHDQRTDPLVGELLDAAGDDKSLKGDKVAEANLREIKRDYDQATKLPKALVEEIARCSSLGMDAWKDAKKNSDFKTFLPWLEKTVELNRKKAECLGLPEGGKEHYDALENDFEGREKELLDEIRTLREKGTRMALENEKLGIDLSIAQQRREAAEQKASSAAARMTDMDVYNKSAALALREKDQEISDLKQAVEEARSAAPRSGK